MASDEHARQTTKIPRPWPMLDCFGLTDPGRRRVDNQDQFLIADLCKQVNVRQSSLSELRERPVAAPAQAKLLMVADGVGGRPAGQRASALAIRSVLRYTLTNLPWFITESEGWEGPLTTLGRVLDRCAAELRSDAARDPKRKGMSTTVTMAIVLWPNLYLVHAGDSRAYLLRDDQLHRLTTDHTFAQALYEEGLLDTPDVGGVAGGLYNAVVAHDESDVTPEMHQVELRGGDMLLMCSDGLTGPVSEELITESLTATSSAEEACELLVHLANEAGGPDNITAVVVRALDSIG